MNAIRNPIEIGIDIVKDIGGSIRAVARALSGSDARHRYAAPAIREVSIADLKDVLLRGVDDFRSARTDIVFIVLIYPVAGLILAHAAFQYDLLPLVFPAAAGFALIGPVAGIGLYEMSKLRERGESPNWTRAFGMLGSPSFGALMSIGLMLMLLFVVWLGVAQWIYSVTLGPAPPTSLGAFVTAVLTTPAGWDMIGLGMGIGFLFAVLVLSISVVSFPMLIDRPVGVRMAIVTSVRVVLHNPVTMAVWGAIVAAGLVIGTIPLFLGLIVVMPILGHATWHLYRKAVDNEGGV